MNEKNKNNQLERFFQHNPIEDSLYLKKYVKDHPDHKMAWYLLGREYTEKCKEAKAAYCYAQAGEIYEVFERQKISVEKKDLIKLLSAQSTVESKSKENPKWKLAVLAALLLFFYIPASVDIAKSDSRVTRASGETSVTLPIAENKWVQSENVNPLPVEQGTKIFYITGNGNQELEKMILPTEYIWKHSLLIEGVRTPDGQWVNWFKPPKILIGVDRNETNKEQPQIQYYDAGICSCQAGETSKVIPVVEKWIQDREESIVLSSAITAYEQKTGVLPEKSEQIVKSYPDNLLPGITPSMQAMFPKVLSEHKEFQAGGTSSDTIAKASDEVPNKPQKEQQTNTQKSSQGKAATASISYPLQEPLQILIDTDKHRLVLVSGKYVIRSYPVGLGGGKTPEGEFIISEKVRNPNGKSNGEFGSRGMTLSDTLYAIHGTNKPLSIGKDESHGCVRMLQEDIEELYDMVPQQTKVTIGKGNIPSADGDSMGEGKSSKAFKAPLQTEDSNPGKKYKWLD